MEMGLALASAAKVIICPPTRASDALPREEEKTSLYAGPDWGNRGPYQDQTGTRQKVFCLAHHIKLEAQNKQHSIIVSSTRILPPANFLTCQTLALVSAPQRVIETSVHREGFLIGTPSPSSPS